MAYVHYRWEEEEEVPVLYCYEIQLEAAVQRKGLGKCAHWATLPTPTQLAPNCSRRVHRVGKMQCHTCASWPLQRWLVCSLLVPSHSALSPRGHAGAP